MVHLCQSQLHTGYTMPLDRRDETCPLCSFQFIYSYVQSSQGLLCKNQSHWVWEQMSRFQYGQYAYYFTSWCQDPLKSISVSWCGSPHVWRTFVSLCDLPYHNQQLCPANQRINERKLKTKPRLRHTPGSESSTCKENDAETHMVLH